MAEKNGAAGAGAGTVKTGLARVICEGLGGGAMTTLAALLVAVAATTTAWLLGSARSDLNADAARLGHLAEAMEAFIVTAVVGVGGALVLGVLTTAALWAAFSSRGLPLRKEAADRLAVLPSVVLILGVMSYESALVTSGWDAPDAVLLAATLGSSAGAIFGGVGVISTARHAFSVLGATGRIEKYHRAVVRSMYGEGSRDRFLPKQVVALYRSGLAPEQAAALMRAGLSPERAAAAGPEAAATPVLGDGWL